MLDLQEYVVTLKDYCDLNSFYDDMETPGGDLYIPNREVEVINRRVNSRNTHYLLTEKEAQLLRNDNRVLEVELVPSARGVRPGLCVEQSSTNWNKSNTTGNTMKNWGLLRCVEGSHRVGWGSDGSTTQTATIKLTSSGKNVDVVICDENGIVWNHPEYAVNADGTGGTRTHQYNWYQHDPVVKGTAATTYSYGAGNHSSHVAGTVAGNTQGWARDAEIYNIYYAAGYTDANNPFPYVVDYIREFHKNKPINPITGKKNPTIVNNSWGESLFSSDWTFNDITAVTYRGTRYVPSGEVTYLGFSGVCNASSRLANLIKFENGGNRITTAVNSATVTELTPATLYGTTGLTASTTPSSGNNDDGFWALTLPFSINFLGTAYSTIYVGTNMYVTFGTGSTAWSGISASNPPYPKIMVCSQDNSAQRIYYGTTGSSPNRIYRVRIEGTNTTSGVLNSPNMVVEYSFYENNPNQIDQIIGTNAAKTTAAVFSTEQLNAWGFIEAQRIPQRVAALDADLEDAMKEGIIFVGASGNGKWKHDVPGGADWNNTFEMNIRYPGQVYYYMRGSSPTANDSKALGGDFDINNICVGAIDATSVETKSWFSDTGPGTDIYAPGTYIISAATSGVSDARNSAYYVAKLSGTSMASPQVCGALACALETYPDMNQDSAKAYILHYAKRDQITEGFNGPTDTTDLQGGENLYLFYYKERPDNGTTFPKTNYKPRPASGTVFPRPRIRRY